MTRVLIAVPRFLEDAPHLELLERAGFEPVVPPRVPLGEEELLREIEGISATIAGSEPYNARVLEAARSLRVIARVGVGYDAIDVPAATERGIAVAITPGANNDAVAEHTLSLVLALAKGVVRNDAVLRSGVWKRGPTVPLRGSTLGIVGLGRIGRSVARWGIALQMRVVAYEPLPDRDFVSRHPVELVPLEQLLAEADFVTLHTPLTPETRHLISRRTLALMKPTSFLVNTARGSLVCEEDLLAALDAGMIAGAGLDVFETEPLAHEAVRRHEKVVISPHLAGVDRRSYADMAVSAAEAVIALSRGRWPEEKLVNPEVRARFRW
jgi:phosphoglycerate dehydrogenase-like enzyme